MQSYTTLQQEADALEARASLLRSQAEEEKEKETAKKGIEAWLDYTFESSSGLTEPFARFSQQIKTDLKKRMICYDMLSFSRGHFCFSAFFKNGHTGKIVYVSSDDVRGSTAWYNNLLIRTAEHDKDYTGGSNNFTTLPNIRKNADNLTA